MAIALLFISARCADRPLWPLTTDMTLAVNRLSTGKRLFTRHRRRFVTRGDGPARSVELDAFEVVTGPRGTR